MPAPGAVPHDPFATCDMTQTPQTRATRSSFWSLTVVGAAILAGCASPIPPAPPPAVPAPPPQAVIVAPPPPPRGRPRAAQRPQARTPREYRTDAAGHLYARNRNRIYTGKCPAALRRWGAAGAWDTSGPSQWPELDASAQPRPRGDGRNRAYGAPGCSTRCRLLGRQTYTDTWPGPAAGASTRHPDPRPTRDADYAPPGYQLTGGPAWQPGRHPNPTDARPPNRQRPVAKATSAPPAGSRWSAPSVVRGG